MKKVFVGSFRWIKKRLKSDVRNFLHFFLAFTGIFLALSIIILATSRYGMYLSADQQIRTLSGNTTQLLQMGTRTFAPNAGNQGNTAATQSSSSRENQGDNGTRGFLAPNTNVVLFGENGKILNGSTDQAATLFLETGNEKPNAALLNSLGTVTIEGFTYRSILLAPSNLTTSSGQKIGYIQVLVNVDQIQDSLAATSRIIIIVMTSFWLFSIFIAVYLSRWSRKPLEAALNRQEAFVSNAAHELRTPLAILQNRLQLLFQKPSATIIDESENISASLNEVRNMRLLTNNLLELAKREQDFEVHTQEVERSYFQELFENYELLARDAGKKFEGFVKFDGSVQVDPDLTKQLLTIFFDNAMKYTQADGQVEITVSKSSQHLMLSISDNGPGISGRDKEKIFDRFYRVDQARTRGRGGLGLGLSLAKIIAEKMRGKITLSDNKPIGTIFTIRIRL